MTAAANTVTVEEGLRLMAEAETEEHFMQRIIDLARQLGWLVYHCRDSRGSQPGFPDLILLKGKKLIVWECKSLKGRTTPSQQEWLDAFWCAGVTEAHVIHPPAWEYIRRTLEEG